MVCSNPSLPDSVLKFPELLADLFRDTPVSSIRTTSARSSIVPKEFLVSPNSAARSVTARMNSLRAFGA